MADIFNLKLHRKRKARTLKEFEAATNRAKFGRTRDERKLADSKRELDNKRLDSHKLEE